MQGAAISSDGEWDFEYDPDTIQSEYQGDDWLGYLGHRLHHKNHHSNHRHYHINMRDHHGNQYGQLWLPGNRSPEEWRSCHGMSCDLYEKTREKIREIMAIGAADSKTGISGQDERVGSI